MAAQFMVARCRVCQKIVAAAVATTPEEEREALKDGAKWLRRGDDVAMESWSGEGARPEWCESECRGRRK
jgi:hypothetical protein